MPKRTYDRITGGCCVVALCSAFFFDQTTGVWQWAIGAAGVLAGCVAGFVYLYNRWHHEGRISSEERESRVKSSLLSLRKIESEVVMEAVRLSQPLREMEDIRERLAKLYPARPNRLPVYTRATVRRLLANKAAMRSYSNSWKSLGEEKGIIVVVRQAPQHEFRAVPGGGLSIHLSEKQKKGKAVEYAEVSDVAPSWSRLASYPQSEMGH